MAGARSVRTVLIVHHNHRGRNRGHVWCQRNSESTRESNGHRVKAVLLAATPVKEIMEDMIIDTNNLVLKTRALP